LIVPQIGRYLWDWYFDLSDSLLRVRDGIVTPIPPSEFEAWRSATGNIVYPSEYAILRAMDAAYCAEMRVEVKAFQEREREMREADAARNKNKPGRRAR
jgi:hypothetical protein